MDKNGCIRELKKVDISPSSTELIGSDSEGILGSIEFKNQFIRENGSARRITTEGSMQFVFEENHKRRPQTHWSPTARHPSSLEELGTGKKYKEIGGVGQLPRPKSRGS